MGFLIDFSSLTSFFLSVQSCRRLSFLLLQSSFVTICNQKQNFQLKALSVLEYRASPFPYDSTLL